MTERPVLVTGANGNIGSVAINNLLDRNVKVRAFVQMGLLPRRNKNLL
jgi:uncharacterized protein YbjT (DUF2867 family)